MDETPSYSEDNYAERFLAGMSFFPEDDRIFHRAGFAYDAIAALGTAEISAASLSIPLSYQSGAAGRLVICPLEGGLLRLQLGPAGARFAETSPMLTRPAPCEVLESAAPWTLSEDPARYCVELTGYRLELDKQPFCLRIVSAAGETIFESETEKLVGRSTAPPAGLRRPDDDPTGEGWAFLSWHSRNADRYFGLGEKFTRFEKTGTRATIWAADTCGSNTTDLSYKAVPVLFSTAGWALMLHSSFRSHWEVGSFSHATGSLLVEDSRLDLFFILAPTLKEQVMAYTALTGRPPLPPRWALGVWMSRAAYQNREQMLEVAERLRAEQIPCDTFNIDPSWMERAYYNEIGVEVCNFNWDTAAWGDPQDLFREFASMGFGTCLWINPYLSEDSPLYQEAKRKGYLVMTTEGSLARLEFNLAAGLVDFTNPEAKAWWQGLLADLLQKGAATFKVDFGDRVPEDALFFNRQTGREMHNLYVHLYAQAVFEVTEQTRGQGFIWRRPGYIGTQRYPGSWAGDTQVSWEGMAGALRGGLSAAFTGEALWGHDIGGFVGPLPSEELYIRWAQFGLLSPLARFHGNTPREPWHYGQKALEVVRHYSRLRYSLTPYLLGYAQESSQTGLPLLRPLVLEFPAEPRIDTIDDQYLLGPDLLVAPVFQPGARSRVVYLPRGHWWPLERHTAASPHVSGLHAAGIHAAGLHAAGTAAAGPLQGGGFIEAEAPLESLPVFVRAGALIPRYRQAPQHLKDPAPDHWLLDLYPPSPGSASQRRLEIDEGAFRLIIEYRADAAGGRLDISPAPITLAVRLIDRRPTFLRAAHGLPLQPGDSSATFSVDASRGASIEFRS